MRHGQRLELLERHPRFTAALHIIKTLQLKGFYTVFAGGGVRDALLGIQPGDLDLATSAPPDEVEHAFQKTLAVGKAFGTIVVVEDGESFEVTTFRDDGPYLDGRHPSSVTFTDARRDAERRDFTVNALFYDPLKSEILDFVGGIEDLNARLLRTVRVAADRFREDRLRMLRAARFVAQLGFSLDGEALKAMRAQAGELVDVSVERILTETKKLLESSHRISGLRCLIESGLAGVYWPELRKLDGLEKFPDFLNWTNAFAALCILNGVRDPSARLKGWRVSREDLRRVQAQLTAVEVFKNAMSTRAERARALGGEVFAELPILLQGCFPGEQVEAWIREYLQVADEQGCLPKAFLNGEDLRAAGVLPGEMMGRMLKEIFDAQLEGRIASRAQALEELKKLQSKV